MGGVGAPGLDANDTDFLLHGFDGDGLFGQPAKRPGNTGMIAAGNLAGLPAIFFPCGFGTDGLPVGLQLVGRPFSEPLLVAIASAYQRATGHHQEHPRD